MVPANDSVDARHNISASTNFFMVLSLLWICDATVVPLQGRREMSPRSFIVSMGTGGVEPPTSLGTMDLQRCIQFAYCIPRCNPKVFYPTELRPLKCAVLRAQKP